MKLLLDENLSPSLVTRLVGLYPGSAHVRDVGLRGQADVLIWKHAAENDFIIVSKDTDFYQRGLVHGAPPKIIWLRIGNAPTEVIEALLIDAHLLIRRFDEDRVSSVLILPTSM